MAPRAAERLAVGAARTAYEAARRAARDVEARASVWRHDDGTWESVDAGLNPEVFARIEQLKVDFDALTAAEAAARAAFDEASATYDAAARAEPVIAGDEPLLLLPVRIEAIYTEGAPEMRIRVYPDDIHVDAHDEALTPIEHVAGRAYWTAVHAAADDPSAREAAWRDLVRACTGARAAWVARVLTPMNAPPAVPQFPEVARRETAWTRAAETTLLPDHFEFSAYRDGELVWRVPGEQIPMPLPVGLAPEPDDDEDADGLPFDRQSRWLIDFGRAVDCGMAVVVPLASVDERFDLLTVVGTSSADATTGADRVQRALMAHAYSGGLGPIPVGTPTNNTPASRSGWRSRTAPPDPATASARLAAYDATSDQEAARVARALGIDGTAVVASVCDPDGGDEALLRRIHHLQAEYYSWSRSFRPTSNDAAAPTPTEEPWFPPVAAHFTDHVRARGPLPPLRIGRQPYGILPVGSLDLWRGDDIPPDIVDFVASFLAAFALAVPNAARIGEAVDQDAVLLDLLGRDGAPGRIHHDYDFNHGDLGEGPPPAAVGAIPASRRLAWQVIESGPGPDEPGGDPYRRFEAFPATVPSELADLVAEHPLTQLLVLFDEAIQTMRDTQAAPDAAAFGARYDPLSRRLAQLRAEPTRSVFYDQAEWVYNALNNYCQAGPVLGAEIARRITEATRFRNLFSRFVAFEDDLAADLPHVERLLREALEPLSHRVDAWVTSLATARLAAIRAATPAGIRLGAYGWLAEVEPITPNAPVEGFVVAPSLHHATTTAVLRSGWQAHSNRTAFAVDIQSARVRRAQAVIDGVRGGQTVGALLGYQFERALHDAHLDRFVAGFRAAYPLAPVVEPDALATTEARIAIGARDVVDGQALRGDRARLDDDAALAAVAGSDLAGDAPTLRRLIDEVDETFDGVGDLLLAESVHQLVAGNPVRAGAAADAAGRGLELPAEYDVLRTPRAGTAATHRVAIAYPAASPPGWSNDRPLARLEPGLEAWMRERLGPADSWPFGGSLAGWCALDVLVATPEALGATIADGERGDDFVLLCDRLRAALAGAQPLSATDLDPAVGPSGVDLGELHARVGPWLAAVRTARDALATVSADDAGAILTSLVALGVQVGTGAGDVDQARTLLAGAALDDLGAPPDPVNEPALAATWSASVTARVRAVLHPAVVVAPVLTAALPPAPEPPVDADQVDSWRRDVGLVRPAVERLDAALAVAEVVADSPVPAVAIHQPALADGPVAWIAIAPPRDDTNPPSSVVLTGAMGPRSAGAVIDSWTEVVPHARREYGPEEVVGVAFEFDRPGARAPQAALVAVPPDRSRGWCSEDVHACVEEALSLAQVRTLDLADLPALRGVLPIPDGQG